MTRTLVMGDPQGPFDKLVEVLARHAALDGDRLAGDVVLVSIGDHFDYDFRNWASAGKEGLRFLRWLASHDAAQVKLLLGNHDASRVMELVAISDERFAAARAFARALDGDPGAGARFRAAFPELPSAGLAGRDFASFCVEQRALIMELLLAGRFALALVGVLPDGREILLTHAGVTRRELAMLGVPAEPAEPGPIAERLQARLAAAVDQVRDDWARGVPAPLSLEPLHVAGIPGEEGGGLLYHRPTNPERRGADHAWQLAADRPRRFDPRTLPVGLTQVAGHTGHNKCLAELAGWATAAARGRQHGGIRTLRLAGTTVTYDLGVAEPASGVADLILIDGELRRVPADEVALLPLAALM
ncbi:MAG TPA: metallophosphoesterase [Kofleriaceae bacterium]|nr:metallophosphoesterase [Kofleriaceae bacterium]